MFSSHVALKYLQKSPAAQGWQESFAWASIESDAPSDSMLAQAILTKASGTKARAAVL